MSRGVSVERTTFALNAPFRIARGVKDRIEVVTVTLRHGGHAGRGEGVPYPHYGETVEDSCAAIEEQQAFLERGGTRAELLQRMPASAARNAVDCALWDLEARLHRKSVPHLLGLAPPVRTRTALTVALDSPEAMAAAAAALPARALVKVKVDGSLPEEQIRAVRASLPLATLIVDPNESWDEALVRCLQPFLREVGAALLEQPVPAGSDEWLQGFTPLVAICADEAVHTADDLPRIAARYQAVNVKLDKAGGLTAAMELARAARAHGLGLMTGCMVCSSLSIAPALHVAALSDHADLDGPLWLRQDHPGGVRAADGYLLGPDPGFWGHQQGTNEP